MAYCLELSSLVKAGEFLRWRKQNKTSIRFPRLSALEKELWGKNPKVGDVDEFYCREKGGHAGLQRTVLLEYGTPVLWTH